MGDWNSVLILNSDADIKNAKKLQTSVRFNKIHLRDNDLNEHSSKMNEKDLYYPFPSVLWEL